MHPSWMSAPRLGRTTDQVCRLSQARRLRRADARSATVYQSMTSNSAEVDDDSTVRTFGMLSTFPPTACGIATFAAALSAGLVANGAAVDVVRCGSDEVLEDPLVVAALGNGSVARRAVCVDALNSTDVAIIQHEYGI